tara:strand:- start:1675 stop:1902 length:228 start_codon:yes stop_codon:yes gene_type:complete
LLRTRAKVGLIARLVSHVDVSLQKVGASALTPLVVLPNRNVQRKALLPRKDQVVSLGKVKKSSAVAKGKEEEIRD